MHDRERTWFARSGALMVSFTLILSACSSSSSPSPAQSAAPSVEASAGTSAAPSATLGGTVETMTYFGADLGEKALAKLFGTFTAETGVKVDINPVGHEDFKTGILIQLAGNNPPDAFTSWAGARTAFEQKSGSLMPIDDIWAANNLDQAFPATMAASASTYDGKKYLLPFGAHYVGLFFSPAVMAKVGITEAPKTWDDLMADCKKIKDAGITPIALGSKNRWPAQFWFDYLLLRTAGVEYRAKLMSGAASYTDPEVKKAMGYWKQLLDAGYITKGANAYDWTDAADQVAKGQAAMTLMGTWITGYLDGINLKPGTDYDFYQFPTVDPTVPPDAMVGPVDGWVIAAKAKNVDQAKALLTFLAKPEIQTEWAVSQGAIPPNVKADLKKVNSVMQKAAQAMAAAKSFNFNYDLATPPAVAEVGLNMFAQFVDSPGDIDALLATAQTQAQKEFKR